jgi:hypothetical protein
VAIQLTDGRVLAFMTKDNVETANKLLKQRLFKSAPPNGQSSQ